MGTKKVIEEDGKTVVIRRVPVFIVDKDHTYLDYQYWAKSPIYQWIEENALHTNHYNERLPEEDGFYRMVYMADFYEKKLLELYLRFPEMANISIDNF